MGALNIAFLVGLFLRLVLVSATIVVISIAGYCDAQFGESYVITYVVSSIVLVFNAAMVYRAWYMFRSPFAKQSEATWELYCYGVIDWLLAGACVASVIFMVMWDYGRAGNAPWPYHYVADPWRMYAFWIQSGVAALQFVLGIGICVCSCTISTKARRTKRPVPMQNLPRYA